MPAMNENQLQAAIVQYAQLNGWLAYHTYDSRKSARGFPDLVLIRERLVMVELKAEKGVLSEPQGRWLLALEAAGVECHVWRPADWRSGAVDRVLSR